MRHAMALLAAFILLASSPVGVADEEEVDVTLAGLLAEMVDLQRFAHLPDPPFTMRQASSYDRRSQRPEDAAGWFTNTDAGHFQRIETVGGKKRFVLLDVGGPGAVVRIWSANPKGTLRVEIDGDVVAEAPMAELLSGASEPFEAGFSYVAARGYNLYFPFPYQRRCVISCDQGDFYYHVGYRTYAAGTRVEPLSAQVLANDAHRMARTAKLLRRGFYAVEMDEENQAFSITPDRPHVVKRPGGGAALTLTFTNVPNDARLLRQTLLVLRFDGVETVRVPLGDFFGTGPGLHDTRSEPLVVDSAGELWTSFPMPFRERMEIGLAGDGLKTLEGDVDVVSRAWDERNVYFHAVWRSEYGIPMKVPRDWTFVDVEGDGFLVGTVMQVANPARNWWGEGDEKIYVDGEAFPSLFGTGTEDYYGYAWCSPRPFEAAYHAQPRCDGPGNYGHTSLQRWHIVDPIPFRARLRFDMEIWHHRRDLELHVGAVAYFYARPGAKVIVPKPVREARLPPSLPALKELVIPGALEGEESEIWASAGKATAQNLVHYGEARWSRDAHLWWRGAQVDDALNVFFDAPAAGRYRVIVYLTKARDYGRHRLFVNGLPAGSPPGSPFDLWAEEVEPSGKVDLGVYALKKGRNELRARVAGANRKASGDRHMFGLDCIVLEAE